jgi:hypothetical protein
MGSDTSHKLSTDCRGYTALHLAQETPGNKLKRSYRTPNKRIYASTANSIRARRDIRVLLGGSTVRQHMELKAHVNTPPETPLRTQHNTSGLDLNNAVFERSKDGAFLNIVMRKIPMSQLKYKHTKFGYDMNKTVALLYDGTTIIEEHSGWYEPKSGSLINRSTQGVLTLAKTTGCKLQDSAGDIATRQNRIIQGSWQG